MALQVKFAKLFYLVVSCFDDFFSFLRLEDIPGEDAETFKQYTKEELEGSDVDQYKHELNLLEENLSAKRPDLKAIEEFKRKEAVYLERVAELDEITQIRDRARKRHDDLRKTRLNEFMEGFGIITGKLKEICQENWLSFFKAPVSVSRALLDIKFSTFSQKFE